jgi:Zn-dependent protease
MRPKFNPNYPTTGVLILSLVAGLFLLVIGIPGISILHNELTTGQVYRVSVVFGDGTLVSRSRSPVEYWVMMVPQGIGFASAIVFGIWGPISTVIDYRKKLARQKKEKMKKNEPTSQL